MSVSDVGIVYNDSVREILRSMVMEKIRTFFDKFRQLIHNYNNKKALAYVKIQCNSKIIERKY